MTTPRRTSGSPTPFEQAGSGRMAGRVMPDVGRAGTPAAIADFFLKGLHRLLFGVAQCQVVRRARGNMLCAER
jgi:hypothetical protein